MLLVDFDWRLVQFSPVVNYKVQNFENLPFYFYSTIFFYSTAKRHGAHSAVACAEAVWVWAP